MMLFVYDVIATYFVLTTRYMGSPAVLNVIHVVAK